MSHEFEPIEVDTEGLSARQKLTLIVGLLIVAAMAVFVVQNGENAEVSWLTLDASLPLWLVMAVSAVAGALIALIAGFFVRRRSS